MSLSYSTYCNLAWFVYCLVQQVLQYEWAFVSHEIAPPTAVSIQDITALINKWLCLWETRTLLRFRQCRNLTPPWTATKKRDISALVCLGIMDTWKSSSVGVGCQTAQHLTYRLLPTAHHLKPWPTNCSGVWSQHQWRLAVTCFGVLAVALGPLCHSGFIY